MKQLMLTLLISISVLSTKAHNIEKICWNQGQYGFRATQVPSGTATIKVYTNSNYSGTPSQTFNVQVTGNSIVYYVNQPLKNTKVYVKVTWSDNYVNKDPSGTNQCISTPIVYGDIKARNIDNYTEITFQMLYTESVTSMSLQFQLLKGENKEFTINFPSQVFFGDVYVILFNNITGTYTITKK